MRFVLTITMIFQNFLSNLREVTKFNFNFHCWRRLPPRSYLYQKKLWSLYFKIPKRTAPHRSAIHRISKSKLLILMKNFGHFCIFSKNDGWLLTGLALSPGRANFKLFFYFMVFVRHIDVSHQLKFQLEIPGNKEDIKKFQITFLKNHGCRLQTLTDWL
jgi:hypothetical protein